MIKKVSEADSEMGGILMKSTVRNNSADSRVDLENASDF